MRSDTRIVAAVAAVGAIALAGCGSSSGSSGAATKPASGTPTSASASTTGKKIDVCKIVTPADAQAVVGGPVEVQAPAGGEGLASGVCIYKASGGGIRVSLLQVRVYPNPQFYGQKALDHTKSIDISGTDKAFVRSGAGGTSVDVQFVKDDKTGTISYTDTGATAAPGTTVTAVERIATKLANAI
jgi:hypothetical protein